MQEFNGMEKISMRATIFSLASVLLATRATEGAVEATEVEVPESENILDASKESAASDKVHDPFANSMQVVGKIVRF